LVLCNEAKNYPNCNGLIEQLHEIDKIITTITASTKNSNN
jgi:hypothetical protein